MRRLRTTLTEPEEEYFRLACTQYNRRLNDHYEAVAKQSERAAAAQHDLRQLLSEGATQAVVIDHMKTSREALIELRSSYVKPDRYEKIKTHLPRLPLLPDPLPGGPPTPLVETFVPPYNSQNNPGFSTAGNPQMLVPMPPYSTVDANLPNTPFVDTTTGDLSTGFIVTDPLNFSLGLAKVMVGVAFVFPEVPDPQVPGLHLAQNIYTMISVSAVPSVQCYVEGSSVDAVGQAEAESAIELWAPTEENGFQEGYSTIVASSGYNQIVTLAGMSYGVEWVPPSATPALTLNYSPTIGTFYLAGGIFVVWVTALALATAEGWTQGVGGSSAEAQILLNVPSITVTLT